MHIDDETFSQLDYARIDWFEVAYQARLREELQKVAHRDYITSPNGKHIHREGMKRVRERKRQEDPEALKAKQREWDAKRRERKRQALIAAGVAPPKQRRSKYAAGAA
jgi:hypothetical protein